MGFPDDGVITGRVPGPFGIAHPLRGPAGPVPTEALLNQLHHYSFPSKRKLKCCFFWTSNATTNNAPAYVAGARKLLQEHNLDIEVCPGVNKTPERTLTFNEMANTSHEEELRMLAHANHYHDGIPVIFCRFAGQLGEDSDSRGCVVRLPNWLPFIMINVDNTAPDGVTLLHELGHACGCEHIKSTPEDRFPNFMSYPPPNRTGILRDQVIKLAQGYFTAGG